MNLPLAASSVPFLDGIGMYSGLYEISVIIFLGGGALVTFIYLWRKQRLNMDQDPAITMMQTNDYQPVQEDRGNDDKQL